MTHGKNEASNLLPITVTEGLSVGLLPSEQHGFLMPTTEVAHGYGTSKYVIQKAFLRNSSELFEGKHFIKGVDILSILQIPNVQPHAIYWTKRGVVRLGFYVKSERAKLFRDWAEELIIKLDEQREMFVKPVRPRQIETRNHNRLTQDRLVSLLADVCQIEDKELRMSITNKLMKGAQA